VNPAILLSGIGLTCCGLAEDFRELCSITWWLGSDETLAVTIQDLWHLFGNPFANAKQAPLPRLLDTSIRCNGIEKAAVGSKNLILEPTAAFVHEALLA
jgi:hypothetical protein